MVHENYCDFSASNTQTNLKNKFNPKGGLLLWLFQKLQKELFTNTQEVDVNALVKDALTLLGV